MSYQNCFSRGQKIHEKTTLIQQHQKTFKRSEDGYHEKVRREQGTSTFKDILTGSKISNQGKSSNVTTNIIGGKILLKPTSMPRIESGNMVVEADKEDYRRGLYKIKFSVIG